MSKILVVDDEANVQRLLQYTLKQAGYTVVVAGDGQEALKLWQSEAPSLILLDVSLPKLDGYAVAEKIRADEGGKHHVPIIMLTRKEVDQKSGASGPRRRYLVKPYTSAELLADEGPALALRRYDASSRHGATGKMIGSTAPGGVGRRRSRSTPRSPPRPSSIAAPSSTPAAVRGSRVFMTSQRSKSVTAS